MLLLTDNVIIIIAVLWFFAIFCCFGLHKKMNTNAIIILATLIFAVFVYFGLKEIAESLEGIAGRL